MVVVDNATGLMWHQGGSDGELMAHDAKRWVKKLNKRGWLNKGGYAGYHDWRLPTVDEAASLLESSKKNGDLYIDPVFSKNQRWIWTGDKREYEDGSEAAWRVSFYVGRVIWSSSSLSSYGVRPVRSVYDSDEEPEEEVYEKVEVLEEEEERSEEEEPKEEDDEISLRSSYKILSTFQVHSMPNVSIREKREYGFKGHSTINHDYNLKAIKGDKVVVDNATGLMWHQSGSDGELTAHDAKRWIKKLNKGGYTGYCDWRLPTLEEAVSLLEPSKRNGLYIDPVFSKKQGWIWTGDGEDGTEEYPSMIIPSEVAWSVNFYGGLVRRRYNVGNIRDYYVRPVRSVK
jgi:hypothetical protein